MNAQDQIKAIQPLLNEIQNSLATGQHPDASPRFKPEATALNHDPTIMDRIPAHIRDCAQDIEIWFDQNNIKEWAFMGIQSRREPVEATAQLEPPTVLAQCAAWHEREMDRLLAVPSYHTTNKSAAFIHGQFAKACREADNQ